MRLRDTRLCWKDQSAHVRRALRRFGGMTRKTLGKRRRESAGATASNCDRASRGRWGVMCRGQRLSLHLDDAPRAARWKSGVKLPANQPTTVAQNQRPHFNLGSRSGDKAEQQAISYQWSCRKLALVLTFTKLGHDFSMRRPGFVPMTA